MSRRRGAGIVPVIGWTLPAFVLATGLSAARADELADLRNNQGSMNETYMDGQGGTGNLPSIPLNTHTFSNTAAPVGVGHSRSSNWNFSGKQTRLFFDARTPSPYGEVKGYIEMDFGAGNTNTILNNNAGVTNGYIPRFRMGYAAMGGLLMGQTNGTFVDNDADPELLDF